MIIIDSDILIWLLRGNLEIKKQFDNQIINNKGLIFVTPVQVTEITASLKENEKMDTEIFLSSMHCIAIDYKTGQLAGYYLNKYKKSHGIMMADALIAAAAYLHNLKIWTLNKKHYPMFKETDFFKV